MRCGCAVNTAEGAERAVDQRRVDHDQRAGEQRDRRLDALQAHRDRAKPSRYSPAGAARTAAAPDHDEHTGPEPMP